MSPHFSSSFVLLRVIRPSLIISPHYQIISNPSTGLKSISRGVVKKQASFICTRSTSRPRSGNRLSFPRPRLPHSPASANYPSTIVTLAHRATTRLQLLQQHLDPYSSRAIAPADYHPQVIRSVDTSTFVKEKRFLSTQAAHRHSVKMSNQEPHPALMIPGPIEFDDAVLGAMSHYS